jgi:hypothetical protein
MLNLCAEFYGAAEELVVGSPTFSSKVFADDF